MPAGPLLAGLEVGLAGVHPRVEVAERLGDGLDPLPVGAGDRVERAGRVVVAGLVEVDELLGLLQQLVGLVLDVGRVVGLGLVDQLLVVGADRAGSSSESVTVKSARMPSPFMPGLQAVT